MKRLTLILVSCFVLNYIYAQNDYDSIGDCNFFNEPIDSNNYLNYIDTIESLNFVYSASEEKYVQLLDCLLSFDSVNPELNFYKAGLFERNEINDTSFFRFYRVCINENFRKGDSYYNMGVFFINELFSWKNDSLGMFGISRNEQEKYLNLAERYMWSSYKSGLKEATFVIGEIQNLKYAYLETAKPRIDLDQDTLRIITKILDCGEFGGHIETIDLINSGEYYEANFFSDSIYCMNEMARPSINSKYNAKSEIISKDLLTLLLNAIDSYEDVGALTNAPVEISIVCNKKVLYQRIQDNRWPHFLEFRKKAFNF